MFETVVRLLARLIVPLFFLGVVGSLGVIAVGLIGDVRDLFPDAE